jgi:hypothetical protein
MEDARFEDGVPASDQPLRLAVESIEDLNVASALLQDAVGKAGEISWMPRKRRLAMLVNRFRWEDHDSAEKQRRSFERVRTAILIDSVLDVKTRGLDPTDKETLYALLNLSFEPGEDGAGRLILHLAGDGDLALDVECLDLRLSDVSKPWVAKAGAPDHKLDDDQ